MKQKYYDVNAVREAITGGLPSISTSFKENGDIDWEAIATNVEFLIASGAKTILLTYGDSLLSILTDQEVVELTKFVVQCTNHRAMVIGCGKKWCLPQTVEFAEVCADAGCDVVIPFLPDWSQHADTDMLLNCYCEVAKKAPVMSLTNLMNGRGIPLELFEKATPDMGIVAVKDDAPAPYGRRLGTVIRDKFAYLSGGTMENFLTVAPYGADGYLSVFFRAFPKIDEMFWSAYMGNDMRGASEIVENYEVAFFQWCASHGVHWDAGIHGMMEIAGIGKRYCRMPYSYMTEGQMDGLREFLVDKKLI